MNTDLIVLARTVHTLDSALQPVEAVAVRDGIVTAIGSREEAGGWRSADTQVVDFGTGTLTPGLVDGHLHPVMALDTVRGCDLSSVQTMEQLREALRREAAAQGPGEWVFAWGLDPTVFGAAPLHRKVIDDVLGDRPCLVRIFDAHSALASSMALVAAGIDGRRTADTAPGIVCDGAGSPTGLLLEWDAISAVTSAIPEDDFEARRARLREFLSALSRAGLTAGHVMDLNKDSLELLMELEREGELPLRLYCAPWCMPGSAEADLGAIADLMQVSGRRWSVNAVKFFIDGTIDNGTAWLSYPDVNGESAAPFWPDPADYTKAVHYFASRGIRTATHAIGDAGITHALDTIASIPSSAPAVLHRIEHIETASDEVIRRFAAAGVAASMQPTHCTHYTRADHSDNWSTRLGDGRADQAWRCRDLREVGATLVLGSDWPIAPFGPLPILADAQLRRRHDRPLDAAVGPAQALTPLQALEGYTTHAARAAGLAEVAGSITVGKRADFTAFECDPLATPPEALATSRVLGTVVGGVVQFIDGLWPAVSATRGAP
jgi:predicted amidohydrolase YtcJ